MGKTVKASELKDYIGQEIGVSDWMHIDQDRVNKFADVTEDHQFIHLDPEAAAKTPFGTTIAHGFLTLSLLTPLAADISLKVENTAMVVNYGSDRVRFLAPVKVGSDIRLRSKLLDVTEKPGNRFLMKSESTIEIKGSDTPALKAETLALVVVA